MDIQPTSTSKAFYFREQERPPVKSPNKIARAVSQLFSPISEDDETDYESIKSVAAPPSPADSGYLGSPFAGSGQATPEKAIKGSLSPNINSVKEEAPLKGNFETKFMIKVDPILKEWKVSQENRSLIFSKVLKPIFSTFEDLFKRIEVSEVGFSIVLYNNHLLSNFQKGIYRALASEIANPNDDDEPWSMTPASHLLYHLFFVSTQGHYKTKEVKIVFKQRVPGDDHDLNKYCSLLKEGQAVASQQHQSVLWVIGEEE